MDSAVRQLSRFEARRAVEQLRSGLFDPHTVRLLTAGQARLEAAAEPGLAGATHHLCLCGAYGQGKSHALRFIQRVALDRNFAVSLVTLDPRETPFHRPHLVYRELVRSLVFPDGPEKLVPRWKAHAKRYIAEGVTPEGLIPDGVPKRLRLVLGALARPTLPLNATQRAQKQHRNYSPRAFPHSLRRALTGEVVPANRIRHALRYRQVPERGGSIAWQGAPSAVSAAGGLAQVFRDMGLAGWVVLFDEGESIAQVRAPSRRKSWRFLEHWIAQRWVGLLPVFAFTHDLLQSLEDDGHTQLHTALEVHQLGDLTAGEWNDLSHRLLHMHARAYAWRPAPKVMPALRERLARAEGGETRLVLKALVDELDLHDQMVPGEP